MVFDELQRTDMTCMLDEFMKEDSDNSHYCLRFVVCCSSDCARPSLHCSLYCSALHHDWRWGLETCVEHHTQLDRLWQLCGGLTNNPHSKLLDTFYTISLERSSFVFFVL